MAAGRASLETENVVASMELAQELDLGRLAFELAGAKYSPDQFPGLVFPLEDLGVVALVYRSGHVTFTGATHRDAIAAAAQRVVDVLEERGIAVPAAPDYTIENLVVSGELGEALPLGKVAVGLWLEATEYDPAQFPGLVYPVAATDTVALLFGNGTVVITGATRLAAAETTIEHLADELAALGLLDRPRP